VERIKEKEKEAIVKIKEGKKGRKWEERNRE
jgi:hypothetical protein